MSRPLANQLELLDPAWCVFPGTHCGVVDLWIPVSHLSRQQQVNQTDHFVGQGDDDFVVCLAHFQTFVLGCQRALGRPCRVGALAQDIADDRIAFSGFSGFSLP